MLRSANPMAIKRNAGADPAGHHAENLEVEAQNGRGGCESMESLE